MKKRIFLLAAALIICVAALAIPASAVDHGGHSADDGWTELTSIGSTLNGGKYYLAGDVEASGVITISGNVTLCLNGRVLNLNGYYIYVYGSGNSLTLCDCNGTKQTHNFTVDEDTGLWTLDEKSGAEPITGGVITGGKSYDDGDGGGVYVYSGTFNMESGSIVGNKSDRYGGGVYVYGGTFTMSGGSIVGNTAGYWGGGVYMSSIGGAFNMSGGSISENTTRLSGGGVYVDGGAFNMSGGSISENTATNDGGGVSVAGTFTMESGSISGNTASRSGGGVYVYSGTFTMSGNASISENTATNDGGGVYAGYDGTFTMSGGSISENTAYGSGGGVYVYSGAFNMSGGSISENAATNTGGGVRVYDGTFNMSGGSISENTATDGGGVFLVDDVNYPPVLKLGGAPVIDGDIRLDSKPIEITAPLTGSTPFLVTNVTNRTFTSGWGTYMRGADPAEFFTVSEIGYSFELDGYGEVYARYPGIFTVTLHTDGGTISSGNVTSYTYGIGVALPTDVTRTGYTFDGWYDEDNNPVTAIGKDETGDKEFWAKWTANTYTVTLHTDGGTISSGNITSYTYGSAVTLPTDVERSGYRFYGWYASADFSGDPVTAIGADETGNKEFWAKWTRKASSPSYKVTVKDSDGGSVTATPGSASKGLTITVKIKPDEGYTLDTLTVTDASGNKLELFKRSDTEYSFSMPGSAVSIEASFEAIEDPVEDSEPLFADVRETDWHYDAVKYVCENGLMNGVSDEYFDPDATLTRSMMVTLLWRLAGEPVVNYLMPFDDVDQGSWYGEAVRWAASEKIVSGVSGDSYAPNDAITREQLAVILYRFAVYMGYDVSVGEDTNILSYSDFAEISEYAIPAIQWATGSGLMRGVTDSELSPHGTATRAQIATMMMRFIESL